MQPDSDRLTQPYPPTSGPGPQPGQEGEHEVELLLNRNCKEIRGVLHYSRTTSGFLCAYVGGRRVGSLPGAGGRVRHCTPRSRGARRNAGAPAVPAGVAVAAVPLVAPAGFQFAAAAKHLES